MINWTFKDKENVDQKKLAEWIDKEIKEEVKDQLKGGKKLKW